MYQSFTFLSSSQIFQENRQPKISGLSTFFPRVLICFVVGILENSLNCSGLRVSILAKIIQEKKEML